MIALLEKYFYLPQFFYSNFNGTPGQISADATYLYICHATDTWRRVATSTW